MINVGAYPTVWVGVSPCSGKSNSLNFNVRQLETRLGMNARPKVGMAITTESWGFKLQQLHWKNRLRETFTTLTEERKEACPSAWTVPLRIPITALTYLGLSSDIYYLVSHLQRQELYWKKISCKWTGQGKSKKHTSSTRFPQIKPCQTLTHNPKSQNTRINLPTLSKTQQAKQTGLDSYEYRTSKESLLNINILKNKTL